MTRKVVAPVAGGPTSALGFERPIERRDEARAAGGRRIGDLGGPKRHEACEFGSTLARGLLRIKVGWRGSKIGPHRQGVSSE